MPPSASADRRRRPFADSPIFLDNVAQINCLGVGVPAAGLRQEMERDGFEEHQFRDAAR
jgi:hypothetical protein